MLSGIRIERSERGMPGEFDWLEKLSVDELRLLADGKLDIASYRKDGTQRVPGQTDMDASLRERLILQVIARAKLPQLLIADVCESDWDLGLSVKPTRRPMWQP